MRRYQSGVRLAAAVVVAIFLATATAQAAPLRVVALEYDGLENLVALGIKPVGGADLRGYRTYDSVALPAGIADVGTRQEPSIEAIAKLKPDLIVVPGYRAGRNLGVLRKIAKVLVTQPYPGDTSAGAQYDAMVADFRALGSAVGRRPRAEAVLARMGQTFTTLRKRLVRAHRGGLRVTLATPGGTSSSPAARLFTANSQAATIMQRIGLRDAWTAAGQHFGFSTVGVEALRQVQSGWLAFVYPRQFATQIAGFTGQDAYKQLALVRQRRVRNLPGDTWLFGGPLSAQAFAQRLAAALIRASI